MWIELLRRYEAQQEPEARLVRYLFAQSIAEASHYLNGGAVLRSLKITADGVTEKHLRQGEQLAAQYPELLEFAAYLRGLLPGSRAASCSGAVRCGGESWLTRPSSTCCCAGGRNLE